MARTPNETIPTQFRLADETLADLDTIVTWLAAQGLPHSRADAVRYAARDLARRLRKKERKSSG
jgi:hypothetical protein